MQNNGFLLNKFDLDYSSVTSYTKPPITWGIMKKLFAALLGFMLVGGISFAASVTVQKGDSLGAIAVRNGTNVATLQRLNGLSSIQIRVGQVLQLPSSSRITVRSGDSLATIAARQGVSVAALRAANGISGDTIKVGQELKLPSPSSKPQTSSRTVVSASITVRSGDSLGAIATRAGVSLEALRTANGLSSDAISIGQVLKLPSNKPTQSTTAKTGTVIVQQGDTLGKIAQRTGVSIKTLQTANKLSGNSIRAGQVLQVSPAAQPKVSTSQSGGISSRNVTIRAGDSLAKIAKRNNISVAALRAANNLSGDAIRVGDTLRLPSKPAAQAASKPSVPASKPKPQVVASKQATANKPKPQATASKPKPQATANKPAANKPNTATSTTKPTATKPKTPTLKPNTRVIAPPPNLPTATGKVITITPSKPVQPKVAATVKPQPSAQANTSKPASKPTAPAKPSTNVTILPSIPNSISSPPVQTAPVVAKPAAPVVVARPATPVATASPQPPQSTKPSDLPSTLGFGEPLEAPIQNDSPIDPALESPDFDATAPDGKPTAPSDLVTDNISIEIPDNLSAASIKPPPNIGNTPTYSRAERVLWPISGVLTSRFGYRRLMGMSFHTGIDLAAPRGSRVYAALSGRVEFAGWNRQGYGYVVIIRGWDNRRSYYGHNSRLLVRPGQWVRQGEVISRVGSTGRSTGPHLHFEIRVANRARNPLAYLPRSRLAQASSVR